MTSCFVEFGFCARMDQMDWSVYKKISFERLFIKLMTKNIKD